MNARRSLLIGAVTVAAVVAVAFAITAYRARQAAAAKAAAKTAPVMSLDQGPVRMKLVILGDSLTEGLGLFVTDAYPSILQKKFDEEGYEVEVINAGLSGDTTAGGLRRLEWVLTPDVRILVVALGGNDALRGISVTNTHDNLAAIIEKANEARVSLIVAGMQAPTNLGEDYRTGFSKIFVDLVREYGVSTVPFLLEGVAGDPELNQADGIHPNAKGARVIAELLYPRLKQIVDDITIR